ncbi:MAG: hypothetical protein KA978_01940 [Deltaproteobacteria bacterium]|nr:hypothetical protein [Deltaproteobacteria bacterium]
MDRGFGLAALLSAATLGSCTAPNDDGEECLFNGDCRDPLVCAARRCRRPCRSDRDCASGLLCRPSGEPGLRVCLPPDETWRCASDEECPSPQVCGPRGQCQPACLVDLDCRFVAFNARCSASGACEVPDAGEGDATGSDAVATDDREAADVSLVDGAADVAEATVDGALPAMDAAVTDAVAMDANDASADGASAPDAAPDASGVDAPPGRPGPDVPLYFDVPPYEAPPPRSAVAVAARSRVCVITAAGQVRCWGPNTYNALGLSTDAGVVDRPTEVPALAGAVEVALARETTCARFAAGNVRCVGRGSLGQLGNGRFVDSTTFVDVSGVTGATSLVAGANGFCALLGDATARCWGFNRFGQAGIAGPDSVATPVSPAGLAGVAELAAGHDHACARLVDGTVRCWGANNYGQLGTNNTSTSVPTPRAVVGISTAAQLAAGYASTCALLRDGSEWCWGSNLYGLLGDGTFTERRAPVRVMNLPAGVTAIQLGSTANCFIHGPERQLSCFGMRPFGDGMAGTGGSIAAPQPLLGLRDVASFRANEVEINATSFSAVRRDGTVAVWGRIGAGVFGPRVLSLGFPLNLELD